MAADNSQDTPWKLILRTYFQEAISFFFPNTANLIDWQIAPEFLDKEFQRIAPDAETGRRFADQLVKVKSRKGQELWLLIHVEVQAAREATFPQRMFTYSLRIFDLFQRPATSLAILCDGNARWRPTHYSFDYPDTSLSFRFGMVKLLDYRDQWTVLEASSNPFAVVVMAHLKAQETKKDSQNRKEWKLQLIRGLYERGYNREDIANLFRFIDWIMILPEGLDRSFWTELQNYEKERRMPYITSVERIGYERGREEEKKALIELQLTQKLEALPKHLANQIEALSLEKLNALAIALLNFSSVIDLEDWLKTHSDK